jgi:hypothetical protein
MVHLDLLNPYSEQGSLDEKFTILDIKASSLPTTRPVTVCEPDGRLRLFAAAGVIV